MEKYEKHINYQIVNISRSDDALDVKNDKVKDVMFSFFPYLSLDEKKQFATAILVAQFLNKDESPLSNELSVYVTFKFSKGLPIIKDNAGEAKIQNHDDLLSIFDTTIGIFRGVLFEWLKGSFLQHPLPMVDMEDFLKNLRITFSK